MGGLPVRISSLDELIQRIDYASSTTQYVGLASPGVATSEARWQIKRLTLTNSRVTAVLFAGSTAESDQIWDNRATLSYG